MRFAFEEANSIPQGLKAADFVSHNTGAEAPAYLNTFTDFAFQAHT